MAEDGIRSQDLDPADEASTDGLVDGEPLAEPGELAPTAAAAKDEVPVAKATEAVTEVAGPATPDLVAGPSALKGAPAETRTAEPSELETEDRAGGAAVTTVGEESWRESVLRRELWTPPGVPQSTADRPTALGGTDRAVPAPVAAAAFPISPVPARRAALPIPVTPAAAAAASHSPLDVFEAEVRPHHRGRAAWILVTTVLVLAAGYVGAQWALADRVPSGTTVAGIDIGGMRSSAAVAALRAGLVDAETHAIPVAAGDKSTSLLPDQAGLSVDAAATVKGLTGFGLEPFRLWVQIAGGGDRRPVTVVDEKAFGTAMTALTDSLAVDPVDGGVVFVDGNPQPMPAVNGAKVVKDEAARLLRDTWLTAPRPIALPVEVVPPTVTQAAVDAAVTDIAGPLTRAPISVSVGHQIAELPPSVVASVASFTPVAGKLTLTLDGKQLREEVVKRTRSLLTAPEDAHFVFENDQPVLRAGAPGTTIDPAALARAVQKAGLSATDRTARVALVPTDPKQSTAAMQALGVKEKVSEFATPLTNEPIRTLNLINGASKMSGQLVRPGETFSTTKALSPITAANGYRMAHALVSGELVNVIGGGLSQMGTTTYNAAFFAGMEDIEHKPHSVYFTRYPAGREATIFEGVVDMKFRNNTPYGVLIQSWVAGGKLHVAMWSTKYWDVATTTSGRSNVVQPKAVHSTSPTCAAKSAGNPGFSVTVTRTLSLNGAVKANESKSWRYKPDDALVCDAAPGP